MAGANGGETHDLRTLLSGTGRDFLIRRNGDQVKVSDLVAKTVGIYFSGNCCVKCREFTPNLLEVYAELFPKGFEVVFVSSDDDEAAFWEFLSEMPWLCVPFSDSSTRQRLRGRFKVSGNAHLVFLDGSTGQVLTDRAIGVLREFGAEGFPFTPERLAKLKEVEEATKRNQTLHSVLASPSWD